MILTSFCLKQYFYHLADKKLEQSDALLKIDLTNNLKELKKLFLDYKDETYEGSSLYDQLLNNSNDEKKLKELINVVSEKIKYKSRVYKAAGKLFKTWESVVTTFEIVSLIKRANLQSKISETNFELIEMILKQKY